MGRAAHYKLAGMRMDTGMLIGMGLIIGGTVATAFAWLMNLVYTRMRPAGSLIRTLTISSILNAIRMMTWLAFQVGLLLPSQSRGHLRQKTESAGEQTDAV
ncbi:MAG TPA: hypothetical protein VF018_04050 [Acidobacteriaceae bacterium]